MEHACPHDFLAANNNPLLLIINFPPPSSVDVWRNRVETGISDHPVPIKTSLPSLLIVVDGNDECYWGYVFMEYARTTA